MIRFEHTINPSFKDKLRAPLPETNFTSYFCRLQLHSIGLDDSQLNKWTASMLESFGKLVFK
jgi:hypothetical protein